MTPQRAGGRDERAGNILVVGRRACLTPAMGVSRVGAAMISREALAQEFYEIWRREMGAPRTVKWPDTGPVPEWKDAGRTNRAMWRAMAGAALAHEGERVPTGDADYLVKTEQERDAVHAWAEVREEELAMWMLLTKTYQAQVKRLEEALEPFATAPQAAETFLVTGRDVNNARAALVHEQEDRIAMQRAEGAVMDAGDIPGDNLERAIQMLTEQRDALRAQVEKWKCGWEEQAALLDQRDGPPVYSAVLRRAENSEAQVERLRESEIRLAKTLMRVMKKDTVEYRVAKAALAADAGKDTE